MKDRMGISGRARSMLAAVAVVSLSCTSVQHASLGAGDKALRTGPVAPASEDSRHPTSGVWVRGKVVSASTGDPLQDVKATLRLVSPEEDVLAPTWGDARSDEAGNIWTVYHRIIMMGPVEEYIVFCSDSEEELPRVYQLGLSKGGYEDWTRRAEKDDLVHTEAGALLWDIGIVRLKPRE